MKQIQLDKQRPIQLNYAAYEEFESLTGVDIYDIKKVILGARNHTTLTFVALKQADPNLALTRDQVRQFMNRKIWESVQEEFLASMDVDTEKKE